MVAVDRSGTWSVARWAVLAAFCVRMVFLVVSHHYGGHGSLQVIGREAGFIAWSLASGKGFANPFPGYEDATAWLAPVFPALWAVGLKIFDPNRGPGGIYFCQTMNSLFSAFTCWPIYCLGKRLFNSTVGLASAWTWVFLPLAILFPLEWAWDQSLSALMMAILLCATYKIRGTPAASLAWPGYGILWALAALVNPTLCALLTFLLAWIFLFQIRSGSFSIQTVSKVILFFLLGILPWTARNYFVLDNLVFIKSNFGLELWLGNNPRVSGIMNGDLHPMNNAGQRIQLVFSGEADYMRNRQRAALAFIEANPATAGKLFLRRVLDTWTASYDSLDDKWITALHLRTAEIYFCAGFSMMALAGLFLAMRTNFVELMPLALCVVVFPIPYYITHTSLRYRHPIDPVLTLFAVYAGVRLFSGSFRGEMIEESEGPEQEHEPLAVTSALSANP
jgi:hypothetical protein